MAKEKLTIVNLVAAQLGAAILLRWISRMTTPGVRYIPLDGDVGSRDRLPLAAAWIRDSRDPVRDEMPAVLRENLPHHSEQARGKATPFEDGLRRDLRAGGS